MIEELDVFISKFVQQLLAQHDIKSPPLILMEKLMHKSNCPSPENRGRVKLKTPHIIY
jgi:hypothetical protein